MDDDDVLNAAAAVDALAFAKAHMRTEQGGLLRFDDAPYTWEIMRDTRPQHVCVACAQSRKTVSYLGKALWTLVYHRPRGFIPTGIYTFPTKEDVTEFSGARADNMIASSTFLAGEIGHLDSKTVKTGKHGWTLYFRGTKTERAALSVPAGLLVHDELDRSQTDTLQMYSDRQRASADPHRFVFSTPTVPKFGISAEWEHSDQAEWVWDCGECGREQCFAPMDKAVHWTAHLDVEARCFRCADCGAPVAPEWVRTGHWKRMAPENSHVAGYHITGIMPAMANAQRLSLEYERAIFPELFVQGHIGLPEVSGEKQLTDDMIRFGDWPNTIQSESETYAGLDQGKKLDMVVGDGSGRIIGVHRLDDWAQVASLMSTLRVRTLVADAQPDLRALQNLLAQFPGRVLFADYSLNVIDKEPFERVKGEPRVRLHRTGVLDWSRDRIVMGGDGGDVWPAMSPQLERDLKAQLTASQRTVDRDASGNPRAVWVETGPDHLRHAHGYYTVAASMTYRAKVRPNDIGINHQVIRATNVDTGIEADVEIRPMTQAQLEAQTTRAVLGQSDTSARDAALEALYPALKRKPKP